MDPLRVAVMLESAQLMDITCMDLLGNCSKAYLEYLSRLEPSLYDLASSAPAITWYYLAESVSQPTSLTSSIHVQPTTTYDDCPRDLDILLVGGPLPRHRPASASNLLRQSVGQGRVGKIFTTGFGSLWLASARVIDGKKVTTSRDFIHLASKMHPEVEWLDQRWTCDGNLWTSGGANAGMKIHAGLTGEYLSSNSSSGRACACQVTLVEDTVS